MKILLEGLGKRYLRHWVFKEMHAGLEAPEAVALLGPNGSGKSTLLRIIAGMQGATTGKVRYWQDEKELPVTEWFQYLSLCAPGLELPEELTLQEFLDFHFQFRSPLPGLDKTAIIELTGLKKAQDKALADFSSGMKQRVKLAQAIMCQSEVLMLDEPCTNLDDSGVAQYREWMARFAAGRLVLVASNDPREYDFCTRQIVLSIT